MIAFIDEHRDAYGVEPICRVLPIAPSSYHERAAQHRDPGRRSARSQRDEGLKPEVMRVFAENFGVYGVRKVWRQMKREGFGVARCSVERLMRDLGLQGVIRGKPVRTTISDKAAPCPLDHVNRHPSPGAQQALGLRFYLCGNLGWVCVCGLRDRRVRSLHRGLAGQPHRPCQLRAGRTGASHPRPPPHSSRRSRPPQR